MDNEVEPDEEFELLLEIDVTDGDLGLNPNDCLLMTLDVNVEVEESTGDDKVGICDGLGDAICDLIEDLRMDGLGVAFGGSIY